ncbi:hypothetical protein ACLOJK_001065 [Asimina triloba]
MYLFGFLVAVLILVPVLIILVAWSRLISRSLHKTENGSCNWNVILEHYGPFFCYSSLYFLLLGIFLFTDELEDAAQNVSSHRKAAVRLTAAFCIVLTLLPLSVLATMLYHRSRSQNRVVPVMPVGLELPQPH